MWDSATSNYRQEYAEQVEQAQHKATLDALRHAQFMRQIETANLHNQERRLLSTWVK